MRKKNNTVENSEAKSVKKIKKSSKGTKVGIVKYEGIIVLALAILCLVGILFLVKTSRETEEILPQEGTHLIDDKINKNNKHSVADAVGFCDKDLDFNILDYATYSDFVNAGNLEPVYIVHDESNIVKNGEVEFYKHRFSNRRTETVRGITLGDTLEELYITYGNPDRYDEYKSDQYTYEGREHKCIYMYTFKVDSVKDFYFVYTFVIDTNNEIIGIVLEPVYMEYWTEPSTQ